MEADGRRSVMRRHAEDIFGAGVRGADPRRLVHRALAAEEQFGGGFRTTDGVRLVAVGKAAAGMAEVALEMIPAELLVESLVVTTHDAVRPVPRSRVLGAGHPQPDQAGLDAARQVADSVDAARRGELVVVLVSGGASSLLAWPVDGVSLGDLVETTGLLLGAGADITDVNCVRKHLERLKGGELARLAAPARVLCLMLSDVVGDDPSVIGSGPTVADPTTFAAAIAVLSATWERVPESVRRHLSAGAAGDHPETPKPGDPVLDAVRNTVVGGNRLSLAAAGDRARLLGYEPRIADEPMTGEARDMARRILTEMESVSSGDRPVCLLFGGETTVTVTGAGTGGRCQEMALALAVAAARTGMAGEWVLACGGSDGRDGPTDAAGAVVDPGTVERLRAGGIDGEAMLDDNDSHRALGVSDDLLVTGPTGTNVADVVVALVTPESATVAPPALATNRSSNDRP